jgi:hypothetical protein
MLATTADREERPVSPTQLQQPRSSRPGGWSGWSSLEHPVGGNVTACVTGDGRVHLLAVGTDNRMHVQAIDGDGSSGWVELDGAGRFELGATPAVVSRAPGRLEVFCRGLDGNVWCNVMAGPAEDRWTGWFPIEHAGPVAGNVAVCSGGTDHLQLFAVGTDEALHTQRWLDDEGWSGWSRLPARPFRDTATPTVVARAPGCFDVFCRGTDRHVWATASPDRFRVDGWSPWRRLAEPGPVGGNIAACTAGPDHLQLFAVGADHHVHTQRWLDGWSGWHRLAGAGPFDVAATPSAVCVAAGRVEVFCRDRDGAVRHHVLSSSSEVVVG